MRMLFAIPVFLLALAPVSAGVVQTLTGRFEGRLEFNKDHLTIDEKKIPWDEVLTVIPDLEIRPTIQGSRVRLNNGETWAADLVALTEKELEIRSDLFGKK